MRYMSNTKGSSKMTSDYVNNDSLETKRNKLNGVTSIISKMKSTITVQD